MHFFPPPLAVTALAYFNPLLFFQLSFQIATLEDEHHACPINAVKTLHGGYYQFSLEDACTLAIDIVQSVHMLL